MNSSDIKDLLRDIHNRYEKLQHENQDLKLQLTSLEKIILRLQTLTNMRKNYTFEVNLPVKVSESLQEQDLQEIKKYLNDHLRDHFKIENPDIKIVTKITNN